MQRILPSLKIHTWGGLGSQLFSVALARDIQKKFPNRKILMVLHTGGVTERLPEVTSLFPELVYEFIKDFDVVKEAQGARRFSKLSNYRSLRQIVKNILDFLGLSATCNYDRDFMHLKPWVLSCRGHYSYRTIDPNFLSELDSRLNNSVDKFILRNTCSIHYRLGDLLTLNEKNPISSKCVLSEYQKLEAKWKFKNLVVFSDSPDKANQLFLGMTAANFATPSSSTVEVMANSLDSEYFIGTSSKISFWISGIRAQVRFKPSLLPFNNLEQYRGLAGNTIRFISTYQAS